MHAVLKPDTRQPCDVVVLLSGTGGNLQAMIDSVLEADDAEHGCSVHFVTEELDGGPLVVQAVVSVELHDTPETLARRVHAQEHLIYPLAIRWFAEGRLVLGEQGALLNGQPLGPRGQVIRAI